MVTYMSLYGLTRGVANGTGPVLAGYLNDNISPASIWYGAGMVGLFAVSTFLIIARRFPHAGEVKPATVLPVKLDGD